MMDLLERADRHTRDILTQVGQFADSRNVHAYLVGGPVRDLWLGLSSLDLDIVIEGDAVAVAKEFCSTVKGTMVTYPAFKTATVTLSDGRMVDFATARKEVYVRPGAFPKVMPSDLKDDLLRRDFTINAVAVAINVKTWGQINDIYGGLKDLKHQHVRVLHANSFIDDPTRILRAVRFSERFGFQIEKSTLVLLQRAIDGGALKTITSQRFKKEYEKILKEKKSSAMIQCLNAWGAN